MANKISLPKIQIIRYISKAMNADKGKNFKVTTQVRFERDESRPDDQYFFFSYHITIKNQGSEPAQLIERHWVITDGLGRVHEVQGPGVIGQQPRILPGASFEYSSFCPLSTPTGAMRGSYKMLTDRQEFFEVPIEEFDLIAADAALQFH